MIGSIDQTTLSNTAYAPPNTNTPQPEVYALLYLPAGTTFSAQIALAQVVTTLLGTDDPIANTSASIVRYITQAPGQGLETTWLNTAPLTSAVSNVANGYAVQFALGVSALSASVQAQAVATVFLQS